MINAYEIVCTATDPRTLCSSYAEVQYSKLSLLKAEEYFARIIDDTMDNSIFECNLNDEYFIATSKITGIIYCYEIRSM